MERNNQNRSSINEEEIDSLLRAANLYEEGLSVEEKNELFNCIQASKSSAKEDENKRRRQSVERANLVNNSPRSNSSINYENESNLFADASKESELEITYQLFRSPQHNQRSSEKSMRLRSKDSPKNVGSVSQTACNNTVKKVRSLLSNISLLKMIPEDSSSQEIGFDENSKKFKTAAENSNDLSATQTESSSSNSTTKRKLACSNVARNVVSDSLELSTFQLNEDSVKKSISSSQPCGKLKKKRNANVYDINRDNDFAGKPSNLPTISKLLLGKQNITSKPLVRKYFNDLPSQFNKRRCDETQEECVNRICNAFTEWHIKIAEDQKKLTKFCKWGKPICVDRQLTNSLIRKPKRKKALKSISTFSSDFDFDSDNHTSDVSSDDDSHIFSVKKTRKTGRCVKRTHATYGPSRLSSRAKDSQSISNNPRHSIKHKKIDEHSMPTSAKEDDVSSNLAENINKENDLNKSVITQKFAEESDSDNSESLIHSPSAFTSSPESLFSERVSRKSFSLLSAEPKSGGTQQDTSLKSFPHLSTEVEGGGIQQDASVRSFPHMSPEIKTYENQLNTSRKSFSFPSTGNKSDGNQQGPSQSSAEPENSKEQNDFSIFLKQGSDIVGTRNAKRKTDADTTFMPPLKRTNDSSFDVLSSSDLETQFEIRPSPLKITRPSRRSLKFNTSVKICSQNSEIWTPKTPKISDCDSEIMKNDSEVTSSFSPMKEVDSDSPFDSESNNMAPKSELFVTCPICQGNFPADSIETHASDCDGLPDNDANCQRISTRARRRQAPRSSSSSSDVLFID